MPSGADKIKAMLRGATIGFVAVVILLLVPVLGVRKGVQDLVSNWQELVLYASCLLTGTVAGARLALNRGSIYEDDDVSGSAPGIESAEKRPEPELINFEEAVELSLAGEPKKRRLGPFVYYFHHDKDRTLALLASIYVILYVSCAALCQKLHLGIIVAGDGDTIIRSIGVGTTLVGLYLCLKGVMRSGRQSTREETVRDTIEKPDAEDETLLQEIKAASQGESSGTEPVEEKAATAVGEPASDAEGGERKGANVPSQKESQAQETPIETAANGLNPHRSSPFRMDGSRRVYSTMVSHIPPTRFRFITRTPICLGALLIFAGLPLVFQAWFPLVAIPGIFIVMSWMFSGDKERPACHL